jgi:hypothetical protein
MRGSHLSPVPEFAGVLRDRIDDLTALEVLQIEDPRWSPPNWPMRPGRTRRSWPFRTTSPTSCHQRSRNARSRKLTSRQRRSVDAST